MPYTKENNIPLYVHKRSNHPQRIIENIPQSINKRLSEISYNEESFAKATPVYQKALDESGYKHRLTFSPLHLKPQQPQHNPQALEIRIAIEKSSGITPHIASM